MSSPVIIQVRQGFEWTPKPPALKLISIPAFNEVWDETSKLVRRNAFVHIALPVRQDIRSTR